MQPPLAGCERRMNVEGGIETVLSTAQILRGKLERIRKALPRDAFDLIAAARTDLSALESAVNSLSPDQRVTAKEHLRQSNSRIASAAGSALAGVPERHRTPHETMGRDAARALHTRVHAGANLRGRDGIIILTVARHGTPRTATMENDPEAALRSSGIAEYLDANSAGRNASPTGYRRLHEANAPPLRFAPADGSIRLRRNGTPASAQSGVVRQHPDRHLPGRALPDR